MPARWFAAGVITGGAIAFITALGVAGTWAAVAFAEDLSDDSETTSTLKEI